MKDNVFLPSLGWLLDDKKRWLRHLLFWVVVYIDVLFSLIGLTDPLEMSVGTFLVLHLIPDLVLVYLSILLLVPKLLFKGKMLLFLAFSLLLLLIYSGYTFTYDYFEGTLDEEYSYFTTFLYAHFLDGVQLFAKAAGLKIFLQYVSNLKKLQELETQNLTTELAYLKNQVHPHFLFNILNSIAVLSEKYPEKVTEAIIQLSKVLRYQLYEGEKEMVPLTNELENLKNYLLLEKMRKNKPTFEFNINGDPNGILVAPFLFLPFIENAIKHGISHQGESNIKVDFDLTKSQILFTIINDIPPVRPTRIEGGIGLKNIQRRLELLYPHRHKLSIENGITFFKVTLQLNPFTNEMHHSR
jgi:sensor histidine kinase YesM